METPNIERFASSGVVFRQAFCAAPTCSPSRGALLTGRYPHQNGLIGLTHRGFAMAETARHLAAILRDRGWTTVLAGTQHELSEGNGFPYARLDGPRRPDPLERDRHTADAASRFLQSRPNEPFFLACGFSLPHREFPKPRESDHWRGPLPPGLLPDTAEVRRDFAGYRRAVREMDDCAGRVLSAIDSSGLAGNTVVVFTTDHGPAFPGMKGQCTDLGIGVSLALRIPGLTSAGTECGAPVSQLDLVPTLMDLTAIPVPADLEGQSLLPLLRGESDAVRDAVFAETNYHVSAEFARMIRTRTHKLIRRFGPSTDTMVWNNIDESPTKAAWRSEPSLWRKPAPVELYDLREDPSESRNLADHPGCTGLRTELEAALWEWMRRTDDPLLHGPIPPPPGARLDDGPQPGGSPGASQQPR